MAMFLMRGSRRIRVETLWLSTHCHTPALGKRSLMTVSCTNTGSYGVGTQQKHNTPSATKNQHQSPLVLLSPSDNIAIGCIRNLSDQKFAVPYSEKSEVWTRWSDIEHWPSIQDDPIQTKLDSLEYRIIAEEKSAQELIEFCCKTDEIKDKAQRDPHIIRFALRNIVFKHYKDLQSQDRFRSWLPRNLYHSRRIFHHTQSEGITRDAALSSIHSSPYFDSFISLLKTSTENTPVKHYPEILYLLYLLGVKGTDPFVTKLYLKVQENPSELDAVGLGYLHDALKGWYRRHPFELLRYTSNYIESTYTDMESLNQISYSQLLYHCYDFLSPDLSARIAEKMTEVVKGYTSQPHIMAQTFQAFYWVRRTKDQKLDNEMDRYHMKFREIMFTGDLGFLTHELEIMMRIFMFRSPPKEMWCCLEVAINLSKQIKSGAEIRDLLAIRRWLKDSSAIQKIERRIKGLQKEQTCKRIPLLSFKNHNSLPIPSKIKQCFFSENDAEMPRDYQGLYFLKNMSAPEKVNKIKAPLIGWGKETKTEDFLFNVNHYLHSTKENIPEYVFEKILRIAQTQSSSTLIYRLSDIVDAVSDRTDKKSPNEQLDTRIDTLKYEIIENIRRNKGNYTSEQLLNVLSNKKFIKDHDFEDWFITHTAKFISGEQCQATLRVCTDFSHHVMRKNYRFPDFSEKYCNTLLDYYAWYKTPARPFVKSLLSYLAYCGSTPSRVNELEAVCKAEYKALLEDGHYISCLKILNAAISCNLNFEEEIKNLFTRSSLQLLDSTMHAEYDKKGIRKATSKLAFVNRNVAILHPEWGIPNISVGIFRSLRKSLPQQPADDKSPAADRSPADASIPKGRKLPETLEMDLAALLTQKWRIQTSFSLQGIHIDVLVKPVNSRHTKPGRSIAFLKLLEAANDPQHTYYPDRDMGKLLEKLGCIVIPVNPKTYLKMDDKARVEFLWRLIFETMNAKLSKHEMKKFLQSSKYNRPRHTSTDTQSEA